jgi:hypothetical protein
MWPTTKLSFLQRIASGVTDVRSQDFGEPHFFRNKLSKAAIYGLGNLPEPTFFNPMSEWNKISPVMMLATFLMSLLSSTQMLHLI